MVGGRRRDRQAVRLLSIFLLLLQGSRLTVHELAARFKTRRETIYRDLRTLGEVGIPIQGDESGRLSRPRLGADYRLRFAPVLRSSRIPSHGPDGAADRRSWLSGPTCLLRQRGRCYFRVEPEVGL
jgi:hypothetical protein